MKPSNIISATGSANLNNKWRIDRNEVQRLWQEGKTCAEISRIFGVTYQAIDYHLKEIRFHQGEKDEKKKIDYNQKINWRVYNEGLVKRGEILLEISIFKDWDEELSRMNRGKAGRPYEFPDSFIRFLMELKCRYKIGYREAKGIARKLCVFIPACEKAPDYSTLEKRFKVLEVSLCIYQDEKEQTVAIDSSGMKTSNRGEYKTLRYDGAKKKEYIKIHIELNIQTNQVIGCEVTTSDVADSEKVGDLIREGQKQGAIKRGLMDSAYDGKGVYGILIAEGIDPGIKPARKGDLEGALERYRRLKEKPDLSKEERAILSRLAEVIEYLTDSKKWKDKKGYGKRWSVEGFFSAFKRVFSDAVFSRKYNLMAKEIMMKCSIMNLFRDICRGYRKVAEFEESAVKIPA